MLNTKAHIYYIKVKIHLCDVYILLYLSVPTKERHILERIDPELRVQIGKALLEDPDNLLVEEEVGKGVGYFHILFSQFT